MAFKKNKKKVTKSRKQEKQEDDDDIVDERFSAAQNRPQFFGNHHNQKQDDSSKVVLDERFASVLTDPRYRIYEKDKYGRRQKRKKNDDNQAEELSAFYTLQEQTNDNDDNNDDPVDNNDESQEESQSEESEQSEKDSSEEEEVEEEDPASRIRYLTALSRGELSVSSSSDDESEHDGNESDSSNDENEEEEEEDAVDGKAGILDPSTKQQEEIPRTTTPSPYMAVMDMDWKHVRAVDLFAILTSFTPPGAVRRVQVFPSNYGMECMAQESQSGPSDLWKTQKSTNAKQGEEKVSDSEDYAGNGESDGADEEESVDAHEQYLKQLLLENEKAESDFDVEKLRAYEASKLKYYFAVVEFASPEHADKAYKEVDGLELEHSSAAMDLRSIPPAEIEGVVQGRLLRDEATCLPSNYKPPDFVINALQQSSVQCTWEDGDTEQHRKLTSYTSGEPGAWGALAEQDDLRAYLASDASTTSDDDEEAEDDGDTKPRDKGSSLRKMLGLDGSSDEDEIEADDDIESSSDDDDDGNDFSKEVAFIPGQAKLEDKIRSKLQSKNEEEITPWQKYQEKRKEKRRERRKGHRKLRNETADSNDTETAKDEDMYGSDPEFGRAEFDSNDGEPADDFVLESRKTKSKAKPMDDEKGNVPSTKEELDLLLAGDDDEEAGKDYDMRGIQRIQKNKDKKLRGPRKRKETKLAAEVSGKDFTLDMKDKRFAAVLDGTDGRFGIDRTDPNYKETDVMKEILAEQTKRRKAKRSKVAKDPVAPNVTATESFEKSCGAAALSSLVMSLKSNVAKKSQ